jgi:hypothetical protein
MSTARNVRFEVVLQASPTDEPIVLRSSANPNTATLAFHDELRRLTTQQATGELIMRKRTSVHPILRQPLASRSSTPERIRCR